MLWVYLGICFLGIAGVVVAPFLRESRKAPVDDRARQGTGGSFVRLSQGVTHVRWTGPARGPVAIVIHGISTPMIAMDGVAAALGQMGYRVLRYDLYGRGLSDAPRGAQDRAFFLRQLSDLCAAHDLDTDITLAGFSMGGAIATAFAAQNPHMVKQVILIAPAGLALKESRFFRFCRRVPVLGDWVHAAFAHGAMRRAIARKGTTPEVTAVLDAQRHALTRRGYLPAQLASRRGMLNEVQEADHRMLHRLGIPVVAVWGRDDKVIPLRASGVLAMWNRNASQEVVEGAGHALPFTHTAELYAALRDLLR